MSSNNSETVFVIEYPHKLTTQLLAQFCGARTEPFTGHVSWVLCRDFKVSIKGQRNMNNGLNNLAMHRTLDERLTFGWAEDNLIRTRLVHENAYEHLAIMIALSEAFHESYAARVMFEMAQMVAGHRDTTPHFRQWKNVIHSLNGAFSTTDFGILVEDYIRLDPYNVVTGINASTSQIPIPAKTVGEALIALDMVTVGKEKQLTITGSVLLPGLRPSQTGCMICASPYSPTKATIYTPLIRAKTPRSFSSSQRNPAVTFRPRHGPRTTSKPRPILPSLLLRSLAIQPRSTILRSLVV